VWGVASLPAGAGLVDLKPMRKTGRQPRSRDGRFGFKPVAAIPNMPAPVAPEIPRRERLDVETLPQKITRINPRDTRIADPRRDPNTIPVKGGAVDAQNAVHRMANAAVKKLGVRVVKKRCPSGELGLFLPEGEPDDDSKQPTVLLDPRQSVQSAASTLAHELAHACDPLTEQLPFDEWDGHRPSFEAVAQLASQRVCAALAVDSRLRTHAYLRSLGYRRWYRLLKYPRGRRDKETAEERRAWVAATKVLDALD